MRVILDTNILISALMVRGTPPDQLYEAWREGLFELVSCDRQLEEINQVSRRPFFRERLRPAEAGRLVNDIRALSSIYGRLPEVGDSPDPNDNFLLSLSVAANAEFLVTGDKSGLLALKRYGKTRIVSARQMVGLIR
jgi:putative PIN family toxin of toxin-antitoxin system